MISDAVLIALVATIGPTVAAIGGMFVAIRNGQKTDEVKAAVGAVDSKAVEIHSLTNSNLAKVSTQLEVANARIEAFSLAASASDKKIDTLERLVTSLVKRTPPVNVDGVSPTPALPAVVKIDDSTPVAVAVAAASHEKPNSGWGALDEAERKSP